MSGDQTLHKIHESRVPPHLILTPKNTCNILAQDEHKMYQFLKILWSNQHLIPSFNCHLARRQESGFGPTQQGFGNVALAHSTWGAPGWIVKSNWEPKKGGNSAG